jgi:Fe-S cluster assembly iron-binding protein IscA
MAGEITISDRAADKIRKLLARAAEGHGLRIKVVEGGGSGFEYKMNIHSPQAED